MLISNSEIADGRDSSYGDFKNEVKAGRFGNRKLHIHDLNSPCVETKKKISTQWFQTPKSVSQMRQPENWNRTLFFVASDA
jgi:hypothetical protein